MVKYGELGEGGEEGVSIYQDIDGSTLHFAHETDGSAARIIKRARHAQSKPTRQARAQHS